MSDNPTDGVHLGDVSADHERLSKALERHRTELPPGHRSEQRRFHPTVPKNGNVKLSPQKRIFVQTILAQKAAGKVDVAGAAQQAGFSPRYGAMLMGMSEIQRAINIAVTQAGKRSGLDLSLTRFTGELDWIITKIKRTINRRTILHGKCPKCQIDVPVLVESDPRTVANLGMALTKAVSVAAKLAGIGPTPQSAGRKPGALYQVGGWGEVLTMLQDDPKSFTQPQRADLMHAAIEDRAFIEEVQRILHPQQRAAVDA